MTDPESVSLQNLARGAVVERFDAAFRSVLDNIMDPNTTHAAREITLKVKIKPDQNRDFGAVDVTCSAKLAPAAPLGTKIFIGRDKTGPVATELDPKQPGLPGVADTKSASVTKLRAVGGDQ